MKRNEIEEILQKNDSTVLSFPDRGKDWGESSYRGNCSGWIIAFLIWKYKVEKLGEIFAGSGTGSDVAKDMHIDYFGVDLNPNPVRNNIISMDAMHDDIPDEFRDRDMIFQHPPYSSLINISWAGKAWKDTIGGLKNLDMGNLPYDKFIKAWNAMTMRFFSAMASGSRMAILCGDIRRNGQFRSMFTDSVKPGQLEQVIIKAQHNCVSDGRQYAHRNFVPIVHEYIMVLKKLSPYMIDFQLPQNHSVDIRDAEMSTWKDVVYAVLRKIDRPASLNEIYAEIQDNKKAKKNAHWKEKVRQILQQLQKTGITQTTNRGVWSLAA